MEEVNLVKANLKSVQSQLLKLRPLERSSANAMAGDIKIGDQYLDYYLDKYKEMMSQQTPSRGAGQTDYRPQSTPYKAASASIIGTAEFGAGYDKWLDTAWGDKSLQGKVVQRTGATSKVQMWERDEALRKNFWTQKLANAQAQKNALTVELGKHPDHRQKNHIEKLIENIGKTEDKINNILEMKNIPTTSPNSIQLGALGRQKETLEQYAMRVNAQNLPEGHKRRLILARPTISHSVA
jgi:hypothetical protein